MRFFKEIKTNKYFVSAFSALLFFALIFANFSDIKAQTTEELNKQKATLQSKLEQINKQIQQYQSQISNTQKKQASLKNELSLYDNQLASTELQIQANETQIEDTTLQINELQVQIELKEKQISENKNILSELIVQLAQLDHNTFLNLSLGNDDFSSFMDQLQYTENLQNKVYTIVQNIKAIKQKLLEQQGDLKQQLSKLEQLKEQLDQTRNALAFQQRQKQSLLDQTKGLERNYQKLLSGSKNEEANLEKEINDLNASIRAKLGDLPISPSKGSLARPISGIMTQGYGKTGFTSLGYNFHNGIDLAGPAGTPIYSAADGVVVSCDTGKAAYGNWCAIKHKISTKGGTSDVVTVYGHMRSFKLKPGQVVKQGDLVGYEGNSGNTTALLYGSERGNHLHFMVCAANGFGISAGAYQKTYGPYTVPYCVTYNPLNFF